MITIESLGQGASTTTFGPTHSDVGTGLSQQKISMGQAATVVAHPTATYPAGQLLYTEFELIKYGCLNPLLVGG